MAIATCISIASRSLAWLLHVTFPYLKVLERDVICISFLNFARVVRSIDCQFVYANLSTMDNFMESWLR